MIQYLELLNKIMDQGIDKADRTGVGTRSIFGHQMRFNLADGFPLVTTKKVFIRGIIHELLWMLMGETNITYLARNDVKIWNEWAYQVYLEKNDLLQKLPRYSDQWKRKLAEFIEQIKNDDQFAQLWGELGPVYGKQWIHWSTPDGKEINQIQNVVELIKNDPTSRRIIVSGWNAGEIWDLVKDHNHAPPSCHSLFQFIVVNNKLSCHLYQRSADTFLGVPFNIASYSLLTMMMAQVTGYQPGEFIHSFGDAHIYQNHVEQVKLQLTRKPRPLPRMKINELVNDIFAFRFEDFMLEGYEPHPSISAPIAV